MSPTGAAYGGPAACARQRGAVTDEGDPLAWAPLGGAGAPGAKTLWFDLGLSSDLTQLTRDDAAAFLDEAAALGWPLSRVVLTARAGDIGAEPDGFDHEPLRSRAAPGIAEEALARGLQTVIVSAADALAPSGRAAPELARLHKAHGTRLRLELGLAHHDRRRHDALRGAGAQEKALKGLAWAAKSGLSFSITAGCEADESDAEARAAYRRLFRRARLPIDAEDPALLRLSRPPAAPEIAQTLRASDWAALPSRPEQLTCAHSRTVIRRAAERSAQVLSCPFILDDPRFEFGRALSASEGPTTLVHPRCAGLCVMAGRGPADSDDAASTRARGAASPRSHAEVSNR